MNLAELLKSAGGRKFVLTVLFAVFVTLNHFFDWLSYNEISTIAGAIGTFVGVEGLADIVSRWRSGK